MRGNIIEDAVEQLFTAHGIAYMRTGSGSQASITSRFGLTISPRPDFLITNASPSGLLLAILECKGASDGGTARDKASRIEKLHSEADRLGVPLFAVLAGLGWRRTKDALGPVIEHTEGRTFTISTLGGMLTVPPFPSLVRTNP